MPQTSPAARKPQVTGVPPKGRPPRPPFPRDHAPVVAAAERAAAQGPAAVEAFWRRVRAEGTPVVEPAADPAERLVTFLWRGAGLADVVLVADRSADAESYERNRMARVPGTDLWHLTYRMRADWRCSYAVAPVPADPGAAPPGPADPMLAVRRSRALAAADPADAPAIARWFDALAHSRPDPLARERLDAAWSVVALPEAPAGPRGGEVPPERVRLHQVASTGLGNTREVAVYTPPGAPPEPGGWPVLVLLDGQDWRPTPFLAEVDRMVAARELAPLLVALVPSLDFATRVRELGCHPPFVDFLTATLLPLLRREHGATADPARTVVAGQSLGGLTALFAAHTAPGRIGRALSQSGSLWWPNAPTAEGEAPGSELMLRLLAEAPELPERLHLSVGLHEWTLLGPTRRLRALLEERGAALDYAEFNGGHDRACWQAGLPAALARVTADWPR
ncbi:enterochelin esterase [Streptomonospora sp. S1-112]|uniref:Enterochelin esterase n=1 Tax=Streptomonospora mangrovi TaxID=2883123 RepID=A0A9X3NN51_9ACTN|nr:enterochelin esterase [Streptomonospora mangrovi]MDA0566812.1 enterochelin esterase [Streptomonospora mangrovi]